MPSTQSTLFPEPTTGPDRAAFLRVLRARTWITRQQLASCLGWDDRKVRMHASALGSDLVKGQRGFCLLDRLPRTDLGHALAAAKAEFSQARKMMKYALGLRRNLHRIIG